MSSLINCLVQAYNCFQSEPKVGLLGLGRVDPALPAVTAVEARLSCSVQQQRNKQKTLKMPGVCAGKAGLMASQEGKGTVVFCCYKCFVYFFF